MVRYILINTCRTTKSFNYEMWMNIYNYMHQDLKLDVLPPKEQPILSLLNAYWKYLWKSEEKINKEFLNLSNVHLIGMKKIWEYIQIIYNICQISEEKLKIKKIISLGAGIEPCLFVFDKLGNKVTT